MRFQINVPEVSIMMILLSSRWENHFLPLLMVKWSFISSPDPKEAKLLHIFLPFIYTDQRVNMEKKKLSLLLNQNVNIKKTNCPSSCTIKVQSKYERKEILHEGHLGKQSCCLVRCVRLVPVLSSR